jgi:hypothetical protein
LPQDSRCILLAPQCPTDRERGATSCCVLCLPVNCFQQRDST